MIDHFGLLAPIYDRLFGRVDVSDLVRLLRLCGGRALDVGGGTGRVAQALCAVAGQVIVSDLSAGMLAQAHQKLCLDVVQSHAEALPFPDNTFDGMIVVDALHHFCDQGQAVAELVRVLKPGGRLVIEEPDIRRWPVKLIALGERLLLMQSRFFAPADVARLATAAGARTEIQNAGRLSFWVIVTK